MEQAERDKYEEKSKQLRAELKQFEADWASRNGGNKPSREHIKQNPDIARKYKKYNQVRDILAGKIPPPQPKKASTPRKRIPDESLAQTPSKRQKSVETPSHLRERIIDPEMFETPSTRKLFSPALPTSIGPTPQRDGRVLGLFDLMEENDENTPSKSKNDESIENFKVQATPSKVSGGMSHSDIMKLGRTPTSTSKRGMLFTTPSKPRDTNAALGRTPTSTSKLQLSTPSFLRRVPLATVDENGNYVSPAPVRLPPKPLGRTLSSVVASLRKLEEEALDDDLEALHEVENDRSLANGTKPIKQKEQILEPDSQGQRLLGGFDNEALYDSAPEEELGRDGKPLKIYKKKGQKRTTRRVNIKPTRSKRPEKPTEDREGSGAEDDVVLETQIDVTKGGSDPIDLGSDSEFDLSDEEVQEKSQAKKLEKAEKKGGKIKKAVKKVNELAHANFKRLKLKNHGAKGPGANNKFRRRR
ncbi:DNA replication/checkpoint protein [Hypomontagnella monticulosa]|nr:DNA replication/checkpoint protein [Hypomontagnella monticulosa]